MEEKKIENTIDYRPQVWLCPATPKNRKLSIDNQFHFTNGDTEYAWAFSQGFRSKWDKLKIGDLCLFGNCKGFVKAAYVSRKINLEQVEEWPFRSPSGLPWSWGFYLTKPFDIQVEANFFINMGRRAWNSQNLLSPEEARLTLQELNL